MTGYSPTHWVLCQLHQSQSVIFRGNKRSLYWARCAQQAGTFSSIKTSNNWELETTLLNILLWKWKLLLPKIELYKAGQRKIANHMPNCHSTNTLLSKYKNNILLTLTVQHISKKGMMYNTILMWGCRSTYSVLFPFSNYIWKSAGNIGANVSKEEEGHHKGCSAEPVLVTGVVQTHTWHWWQRDFYLIPPLQDNFLHCSSM